MQQSNPRAPRCVDFKPRRSNSLLGFATIEFPSKIVIGEIPVLRSGDRFWAAPPGRPKIDREGRAILKANGKQDYAALIWFSDKEAKRRWEEGVVEAVREAYPEALDDEEGAP